MGNTPQRPNQKPKRRGALTSMSQSERLHVNARNASYITAQDKANAAKKAKAAAKPKPGTHGGQRGATQ
jgi:hypothetical protein